MRIFISWSEKRSKMLADSFCRWLPSIFREEIEIFFSDSDIKAGQDWVRILNEKLKETHMAIICLTPENTDSRWIYYEAGAAGNSIDIKRICPCLLDIDLDHCPGPLARFQAKKASYQGILEIVQSINLIIDKPLNLQVLKKTFDNLWPGIEKEIIQILSIPRPVREPEPEWRYRHIEIFASERKASIEAYQEENKKN